MIEVYEYNTQRDVYSRSTPESVADVKFAVANFYTGVDLVMRLVRMAEVRFYYESLQMNCSFNGMPVPEDISKVAGDFHRISTTIVAEELGDDAQYLDKIMEQVWKHTTENIKDQSTAIKLVRKFLEEGEFGPYKKDTDARTDDTDEGN